MLIASLAGFLHISSAEAVVKAGSVCSKVGTSKIHSGSKFTCVKSGKKSVWKKDYSPTSTKPSPNPTPLKSPSSTPSPTSSPSPTVSVIAVPSPIASVSLAPLTSDPTPTQLLPKLVFTSSTFNSYTFTISNYNSQFTWRVSTTAGYHSISTSGKVVISGLKPEEMFTATVTASRPQYKDGSSKIYGEATPESNGFTP